MEYKEDTKSLVWISTDQLPDRSSKSSNIFEFRSETVFGKSKTGRIYRVQYWFDYGVWFYAGTQIIVDIIEWAY
jgi:hypothetical protein